MPIFIGNVNILDIIGTLTMFTFGNYIDNSPFKFDMNVHILKFIDDNNVTNKHILQHYDFDYSDNINSDTHIFYKSNTTKTISFVPIACGNFEIDYNNNVIKEFANNNIEHYKQAFAYLLLQYYQQYKNDGLNIPEYVKNFNEEILVA